MSIPVQSEFRGRFYRNRGFRYERTKHEHSKLEKAFADHWEEENEARPGLNAGQGLLQNLFMESRSNGMFHKCVHQVTPSERYVAATVVQWLGTNCGFSFLQEVLRSQGMYIAEIHEHKPLPEEKPTRGIYVRRLA